MSRDNPIVLTGVNFESAEPGTLQVELFGVGGRRVAFDINERGRLSSGTIGGATILRSDARTPVDDPQAFATQAARLLQAPVEFANWTFERTDRGEALALVLRRGLVWHWVWPAAQSGKVRLLVLQQGTQTDPSIRHSETRTVSFAEAAALIMGQ